MAEIIDRMRIGYNEGELMGLPAVERVQRGIILIIRDTIDHLISLGWDRQLDISIVPENEDGLPSVMLRGRKVFEIRYERMFVDPYTEETAEDRAALSIRGRWIGHIGRPGLLLRALRRMRRARAA